MRVEFDRLLSDEDETFFRGFVLNAGGASSIESRLTLYEGGAAATVRSINQKWAGAGTFTFLPAAL
jgi:hypothetical protein